MICPPNRTKAFGTDPESVASGWLGPSDSAGSVDAMGGAYRLTRHDPTA